MPLSPDHLRRIFQFDPSNAAARLRAAPSYRALRARLDAAEFDEHAESSCAPWRKRATGRPPVPAGRLYRMVFAGFLEGQTTHRAIARLCQSNAAVRDFVGLAPTAPVPHHSTLGAFRTAVPENVHVASLSLLWRIVVPEWTADDAPS